MKTRVLCLLLCALCALPLAAQDFVPPFSWDVDCENPQTELITPMRRSGSLDIRPTFYSYNSLLSLSNVTTVLMLYKPIGSTNSYPATGSVHSVLGVANVRWTPAYELTNVNYSGDIYLMSGSNTVAVCPLKFSLQADTSYQSTTSTPTPISTMDGATVQVFNPQLFPWPYMTGTPAVGQSLVWNGTNWVAATPAGSGDMLASIYDPAGINAQLASLAQLLAGTNGAVALAKTYSDGLAAGYATAAQGVAGTNAQARVAYLEGHGIPAAVTSGVNRIILSGSGYTNDVTFAGARLSAAGNTITWTNTEYISDTKVPIAATYEYIMFGPRRENITLRSVWAQCDAYNVTFAIVEAVSNSAWRTVSTNVRDVVAVPGGIQVTSFGDDVIEAGKRWGIVIQDLDPRAMAFTYCVEIAY